MVHKPDQRHFPVFISHLCYIIFKCAFKLITHSFPLSPVLPVCSPDVRLQPLSSTLCLCKDPATALVSIVYVQTPWCRDIHSLFPVPPEEAGGKQRTMRCHFLNPTFVLFLFFFVQLVLFSSPSSPQALREAVVISN